MPDGIRAILVSNTSSANPNCKPKKKPKCNCDLCSASIGKPKPVPDPCKKCSRTKNTRPCQNVDDIPCIKLAKTPSKRKMHDCGIAKLSSMCQDTRPSRAGSRASRLQEVPEDDESPCRKIKRDIIRRNKLAVRILSKQLRAVKTLTPPCDSRYDQVQLFPTAKHAMRWAPAYSLARSRSHSCPKKAAKNKPPPAKKSSYERILTDKKRTCACELMANALSSNLHHHLGLSDQREQVNATMELSPSKVTEA